MDLKLTESRQHVPSPGRANLHIGGLSVFTPLLLTGGHDHDQLQLLWLTFPEPGDFIQLFTVDSKEDLIEISRNVSPG